MTGGIFFMDTSQQLFLEATNAVSGGDIYLGGGSMMNLRAHDATTAGVGLFFDRRGGRAPLTLFLNGHNTTLGFINTTVLGLRDDRIINGGSNDATLTIDGSFRKAASLFNGSIQNGGSGKLRLRLVDTMLLLTNQDNNFSGGLEIIRSRLHVSSHTAIGHTSSPITFDNGMLYVSETFSMNRELILRGDSWFVIADNKTLTLDGPIRNEGRRQNLVKLNPGSLVLANPNNDYGNTIVREGTLVVRNGALKGDLFNKTQVFFDYDKDGTYNGNIDGEGGDKGRVSKRENGQLTLGGQSTLDWTIERGKLVTAAERFNNNAHLLGSTKLVFGQRNDANYNHLVTGQGALVKTGARQLTLTKNHSYTGGTKIREGTLQLGNGSREGMIVNDVQNDGTLAFNRSDTVRFIHRISGRGALEQRGTGATILTNDNTYTGGTVVRNGVLQIGAGGTAGSLIGNVTNHAKLAFNRSDTVRFDGLIDGNGVFEQLGTGTTVFTKNHQYTGDTVIHNGTLQLGDGSVGGAVLGNIVNHSKLIVNRSDAWQYDGLISGTGLLEKQHTNTTVFTGNHTYTGDTVIRNGTLQLGDGGTRGNVAGNIVNDSRLVLNRSDTWHLNSDISGTGDLVHTGSGTTVLRGQINLTGQALIDGGTLVFGDGQSSTISEVEQLHVRRGIASIQTPAQFDVKNTATFDDHTALSIDQTTTGPALLADKLVLGKEVGFNLSGVTGPLAQDVILIRTTSGIQGDFGPVLIGGFTGPVDYMGLTTRKSANNRDLLVTYALNWFSQNNLSHGQFTLRDQHERFNLDFALDDQSANTHTGWDGQSLSKAGAGTLVLNANNTYTGATLIEDGTLQLGNGGDTGSILGDVTNHGLLAFNRSDTLHFDGVVSGRGGLVQRGTGTTVLTADNTYLGSTFLEDGTLQVSKDSQLGDTGSHIHFKGGTLATTESFDTDRAITLSQADARFHVAADTTLGVRHTLSGEGDLIKLGAGTLRLDHVDNAYGNTRIEEGALIGHARSFSGHIRNAATAIFEQDNDGHYAGDMVGLNDINGQMVKRGDATLVLDGRSLLDWDIQAGTLRTAAERFLGNARIAKDGTLHFAQDRDLRYSGALSGEGTFLKSGQGKFEYDGEGAAFKGLTTITEGEFIVGSAADRRHHLGGSMRVLDGARLGGHGTLGNGADSLISIGAGGTLTPGNSIGTLTIDGDLVFERGAKFSVEADPDQQQVDRVNVTGDIRILTGATADIQATGQHALRSRQTILKADRNLSGQFDHVTSNFAFLTPQLAYDHDLNTVDLELFRNDVSFPDKAVTPNQGGIAAAADSIGVGASHPVYDALALLADDEAMIRQAYNHLSGEVHASVQTAFIDASRLLRDTTTTRLRDAYARPGVTALPTQHAASATSAPNANGPAVWAITHGGWRTSDSDGNAGTLGQRTYGLLMGVDAPIGRASRLGLLTGYSRGSLSVNDRASSGQSDSYHFGVYGGTQFGAAVLQGGVAHTEHDVNMKRLPSFTGFNDRITSRYGARTTQLYADLGYRLSAFSLAFEPFAGIAHVWQNNDSFNENGEHAALSVDAQGAHATFTTMGLRGNSRFQLGRAQFVATGSLGWQHLLNNAAPLSRHRFSAGDPFTIAGLPLARNAANLAVSLDAQLARHTTLGLSYQGQFAPSEKQHGVKMQLDMRF